MAKQNKITDSKLKSQPSNIQHPSLTKSKTANDKHFTKRIDEIEKERKKTVNEF